MLQACEALAEAHALGIVHRDIKPSNLFLTSRPDGTPLVKVLDFGISKAPVGGPGVLTKTDDVMGTPGYMSPEQMKAARDVDARTDVWALGIVLYECLNGRRPFDAEAFSAVVLMTATDPPPPMDPRIPRGLQAVVLRCLEKDRAARFPSIAELAAALAPFARDGRTAAIVVERTTAMLHGRSMGSARSVRPWYAMVGTVLLVGVIAVVAAARLSGSSQSGASEAGSAVQGAGGASDLAAMQRGVDAASTTSPAVDEQRAVAATAEHATAATVDDLPGKPDERTDKAQKAAHCAELEAQKDWQKLRDCGSELAALGDKAKAEDFRVKAVNETASSLAAGKIQQALRDGNLREAQKQLSTIGPDSVYFAATADAFRSAEAQAVDEARRQAQALASARDCAGLKRLQVQLAASSTSAVADAAVVVKCAAKTACDTMNVEDIIEQASAQYAAGFAKAALQLVIKALACKQDVRMYRTAAIYACVAHDAASAKDYFAKAPSQFQSAIILRCQQEGIALP